jgi:DNA-binding NtrC family response regulator
MERVLCIDDDLNILKALRRVLHKKVEVVTAESGEEGLSLLRSEPPFAVIICDGLMPSMDGITFFREARRISPGSALIMLTGIADLYSIPDPANETGIFRIIAKPCENHTLMAAIEDGIIHHMNSLNTL